MEAGVDQGLGAEFLHKKYLGCDQAAITFHLEGRLEVCLWRYFDKLDRRESSHAGQAVGLRNQAAACAQTKADSLERGVRRAIGQKKVTLYWLPRVKLHARLGLVVPRRRRLALAVLGANAGLAGD